MTVAMTQPQIRSKLFRDAEVTFTNNSKTIAHARRAGSRMAICGEYVYISYKCRETILPQTTLCRICEQGLIAEIEEKLKNDE